MNGNGWGGRRSGAGRKRISNEAFEGAIDNYDRTFIYMPECADEELRSWDRRQLMKKARWLTNNVGLAGRAIDGVARYTVGKGISPQARTADRNWNQQAEEAFEAKCGTDSFGFDVAAQVNFYEAQQLVVRQILTDGDFFGQRMLSQSGAGMMHFISGEYCDSETKNANFKDGIRTNELGKPLQYMFVRGNGLKREFYTVSADDVIHFKRLHRHGYVRGVSALRHAVNNIHDMTDILRFTKGSFKLASQIAFILESPEAGKRGLGANVIRMSQGDGTVTHDKMYPLAGHVQLTPNEKLTALKNEHPGGSFDPFMNYLTRDICWGIGVSPEVLWAIAGIGGANTRYVLADAQTFFEELQALLINQFCRKFWVFWLFREIQAGRLPYPGDDWWRHDWLTPGKVTVDFTKDGKLLADLCDRGLLSPDRYYGMQGLDAETQELDVIRRRARRKKQVEEVAAAEGVELTVEECFPPPAGATNVNQLKQGEEVDTTAEE